MGRIGKKNKVELVVWFGATYVETVSIKSFFAIRLLKYFQIEHTLKWVFLPSKSEKMDFEQQMLPVLKDGPVKVVQFKDLQRFCKENLVSNELKCNPTDLTIEERAYLAWTFGSLMGIYIHLLYSDVNIRDRYFNEIKKAHPGVTESHLNEISDAMKDWSRHKVTFYSTDDEIREHIFEVIEKLDVHLRQRKYLCGDKFSVSDIAVFSFIFLVSNPTIGLFSEEIKRSENLYRWAREIDKITTHHHARRHFL